MTRPLIVENFHKSLRNSKLKSIDRFVQRRTEYLDLGKYAIAQELIVRERESRLYPINLPERPRDRYRTLFNEVLPTKPEDLSSCNLRIITFNFDRSFERALFLALSATYSEQDAAVLAKSIPVLHVHGRLGAPSWLPPEEHIDFYRDYTPTIDAQQVFHAGDAIKLSHQEVGPVMDEARKWLSETERICFFGFGFDELNLDRLDIPNSVLGKKIWSTRLGFPMVPV